jgi:hypothetical protein
MNYVHRIPKISLIIKTGACLLLLCVCAATFKQPVSAQCRTMVPQPCPQAYYQYWYDNQIAAGHQCEDVCSSNCAQRYKITEYNYQAELCSNAVTGVDDCYDSPVCPDSYCIKVDKCKSTGEHTDCETLYRCEFEVNFKVFYCAELSEWSCP